MLWGGSKKAKGPKAAPSKADESRAMRLAKDIAKKTAEAACSEILLCGDGDVQGLVFTAVRFASPTTNAVNPSGVWCSRADTLDGEIADTLCFGGILEFIQSRDFPLELRMALAEKIVTGKPVLQDEVEFFMASLTRQADPKKVRG